MHMLDFLSCQISGTTSRSFSLNIHVLVISWERRQLIFVAGNGSEKLSPSSQVSPNDNYLRHVQMAKATQ